MEQQGFLDWVGRSLGFAPGASPDWLGLGLALVAGMGLAALAFFAFRRAIVRALRLDDTLPPQASAGERKAPGIRTFARSEPISHRATAPAAAHEGPYLDDEPEQDHGHDEDGDGAPGKGERKRAEAADRMARSDAVLAHIERQRGTRALAIIHRSTTESDFLVMNDLEDVLSVLRRTPEDMPLDIILHTRGGLSLAAMQISRAIKAHKGRKTVFVPYYAMSAGTLIALAADEIVMAPHACLGPIDPQFGVPAVSILEVMRQKPAQNVDDMTVVFADLSKKALAEAREHACEMMQGTYSHDGSCAISDELVSGRWSHSNPITVEAAARMGLSVAVGVPQDMIDLVRIHRIVRRGIPSVFALKR